MEAAKITDVKEFRTWYDEEVGRLHKELSACFSTPFEHDARHKLADFRRTFHKPVTYAAWDWDATVFFIPGPEGRIPALSPEGYALSAYLPAVLIFDKKIYYIFASVKCFRYFRYHGIKLIGRAVVPNITDIFIHI